MKKKIFAALLAAAMVLSLAACSQKSEDVVKNEGANEVGAQTVGNVDDVFAFEKFKEHSEEKHTAESAGLTSERLEYPNLTSALLDLENGKIQRIPLTQSTADYIAAHNDKFQSNVPAVEGNGNDSGYFSMLTTNTELHGMLDDAIKQLKENGTLEQLIAEDLKAYITSDPTPEELPVFDGAATYKIAVTGDLPPMDFVTADDKAAGFNVALLTEIANIAQVNFELVTVDAGARLTSLASGAVDAVFWTISDDCFICGESLSNVPEGTMITESYFSDHIAMLRLK